MKRLLQHVIRTILLTLLSWLPPDDRLVNELPWRVNWDPTVPRICDICNWTWLTYLPGVWYCPTCSWAALNIGNEKTTDPLTVAVSHRHEKMYAIGDLARKHSLGKITLHGIEELRWEDTGERVNTAQLPRIRREETLTHNSQYE